MSLRMMVAGLMVLTAIGLGMIAFQLYQPPPAPQVAQQQQQPAPPPPQRAKYLVASRSLPAGTLTRDEDFRAVDMEPGKMPEGTLQDTPEVRADLRGALVRNYIDARQPIMPEAVLRPRDRGFLAAVLAPGTRATSIPVDPVSGVSGLIWPGDRVDILLVQDLPDASAAQRIVSETILSDVRVIAVDQHIVQGASAAEGNTGYAARTVTLQVSEDEGQRLSVANRIGRMQLLIRSAEPPPVAVVPESIAVFGGDVSPVLGRRSTLVGLKVRVIQGDAATEVTFK